MSGNYKKEDRRIVKTHRALINSLLILLEKRSFKQITVNDLCEEALVSRATFYAHFYDKYDLLRFWLTYYTENNEGRETLDETGRMAAIDQMIYGNSRAIKNIIDGADNEVMELLLSFMESLVFPDMSEDKGESADPHRLILTNFCAGGLLNLIQWQIKNNYPPEMQDTRKYFHDMLENFMNWAAGRN